MRRLRQHRQHTHGGRQDGHRLAAGRRGCAEITFFADYPIVLGVRRGGACLHVIQCIILLITHSITKYPGQFVHMAVKRCQNASARNCSSQSLRSHSQTTITPGSHISATQGIVPNRFTPLLLCRDLLFWTMLFLEAKNRQCRQQGNLHSRTGTITGTYCSLWGATIRRPVWGFFLICRFIAVLTVFNKRYTSKTLHFSHFKL